MKHIHSMTTRSLHRCRMDEAGGDVRVRMKTAINQIRILVIGTVLPCFALQRLISASML